VKKKGPCTRYSTRPFFLHRQINPRRDSVSRVVASIQGIIRTLEEEMNFPIPVKDYPIAQEYSIGRSFRSINTDARTLFDHSEQDLQETEIFEHRYVLSPKTLIRAKRDSYSSLEVTTDIGVDIVKEHESNQDETHCTSFYEDPSTHSMQDSSGGVSEPATPMNRDNGRVKEGTSIVTFSSLISRALFNFMSDSMTHYNAVTCAGDAINSCLRASSDSEEAGFQMMSLSLGKYAEYYT
jgi:hypothetical protein